MTTSTGSGGRARMVRLGGDAARHAGRSGGYAGAERALVLAVGAAICALGLVAALMSPRAYTARSELIVWMGEERLSAQCGRRGPARRRICRPSSTLKCA
ncbi:MAG: hypothetical protein R3C16_11190 [Hyphomonadaceae bacterium]